MAGIAISVIPLLSQWEKYTAEHPDGDVPGFAQWVLAGQQPAPPTTLRSEPQDNTPGPLLIARIHNILRLLSKPTIKSLGLTKDIEFTTLLHIALMQAPNKKELCRELLIENSTGVEITKRLAQKGMIAETPNPKDRRSALLSLTAKGKKLLQQGNEKLGPVYTAFLTALTPEEKRQFVFLLSRINQYHTEQITRQPDLLQ